MPLKNLIDFILSKFAAASRGSLCDSAASCCNIYCYNLQAYSNITKCFIIDTMEIIACYIAESDVPRDNHLYHFVTVVTCTGDLARKGTSALGPPITTIAAQKKMHIR